MYKRQGQAQPAYARALLWVNVAVAWFAVLLSLTLNLSGYYVASAELVPGHSWPYGLIFGDLAEHPEWTGADLGRAVVRHYTDFYRAHPPRAGDVTKVALDLAGVDTLAAAVGRLAAARAADIAGQAPAVWQAQTAARRQETREGGRGLSKFDYHLWDIGSVARRLAGSSSAPVAAASQAVLAALRDRVAATAAAMAWPERRASDRARSSRARARRRSRPVSASLSRLPVAVAWAIRRAATRRRSRSISKTNWSVSQPAKPET